MYSIRSLSSGNLSSRQSAQVAEDEGRREKQISPRIFSLFPFPPNSSPASHLLLETQLLFDKAQIVTLLKRLNIIAKERIKPKYRDHVPWGFPSHFLDRNWSSVSSLQIQL